MYDYHIHFNATPGFHVFFIMGVWVGFNSINLSKVGVLFKKNSDHFLITHDHDVNMAHIGSIYNFTAVQTLKFHLFQLNPPILYAV